MTILLVSTDLLAASMLEGAAQSAGGELLVASPAAAPTNAEAAPPELVLIDLGSLASEVAPLVEALRCAAPNATLMAYGPHVQKIKLEQAREAGCHRVMSRGELYSRAAEVIAEATS